MRVIRWTAAWIITGVVLTLLAACGSGGTGASTAGTAAPQQGAAEATQVAGGTGASTAATVAAQGTAESTQAAGGAGATGGGKKVGLVLSGPIGVNTFLKAIKDGVEQGGKEAGLQTTVIESRDVPAIEGNLKRLIQSGYDLIVCNSFECVDALKKVAPANPKQRFLIVDATVDGPNVSSAVFREHEGAFLAGAEAALVSKAKKVGFVGPVDIPFIHRWSDGFQQGVQYIDKSVEVQVAWTGSFEDVAKAKELATIQANKGADILFPAAAAGIFGAFEAAKAKGFKTIGVDVDYRVQYPDVVIDSDLKRTDVVTKQSINDFANGKLDPGVKSYGLKEDGIGLASIVAPSPVSDKALGPDVINKLKELQQKIISGEIKVKDPLEQQK